MLKQEAPIGPSTSRLDSLAMRALFYLVAANVVVLFLAGPYDFTLGPFRLHATMLSNWLSLCLAFALAHTWLESRQAGIAISEWIQSPFLLFLSALTVYCLNDRTFLSHDTLPTRLLPVSLLREHDFDLDEFSSIWSTIDIRYFIQNVNGHVVSSYPPWGAVLALPLYLIPVFTGPVPLPIWTIVNAEKQAAALIAALSVVVLLYALKRVTKPQIAWAIAVIYAFGTSCFSTNSQALWQHGPTQLFAVLMLYCLVRAIDTPSFAAWAGLPLGLMVLCRPLNLVMALPIALYVLQRHRGQFMGLILAGLPSLLLLMWYNTAYFGSPFKTAFAGTILSPTAMSGFYTPGIDKLIEGVLGSLFSPARGLLIYSPVFVFSIIGMWLVWTQPGPPLLKYLSLTPFPLLAAIVVYKVWPGGYSYGSRMMADAAPFLCLLLYPAFERFAQKRAAVFAIVSLSALSVFMQAVGVFANCNRLCAGGREVLWSWSDAPPVYVWHQVLSL